MTDITEENIVECEGRYAETVFPYDDVTVVEGYVKQQILANQNKARMYEQYCEITGFANPPDYKKIHDEAIKLKQSVESLDLSFLVQTMESNFKTQGLMIYGTIFEQLKSIQKSLKDCST